MEENFAEEMLDELLPALEALEAQSSAILQFLKDKNIAPDDQLGPYLHQAADASNIRWRAARLRMNKTRIKRSPSVPNRRVSSLPLMRKRVPDRSPRRVSGLSRMRKQVLAT